MIPNKFTLIVCNCQNDLTLSDGALYIKGSENKVNNICKFISENADKIERVILTKDNHPKDHKSFVKNGGELPQHCIEGTYGNKINEDILNTLKKHKIEYYTLCKGEVQDFEEYSAAMYSDIIDNVYVMKTATDAKKIPTDDIVICGVAGEYSVLHTILDMRKLIKDNHIHLFLDGIASIDEGDAITDLITDKVDLQIV